MVCSNVLAHGHAVCSVFLWSTLLDEAAIAEKCSSSI